ncbi:lipoprotein-releasing ABC transporter permease subunit [Legionella oakridgensis]|uniref:Lipoprotein releasing system, transmembrane protein, LolC/E family n=2 Tax=Legionella oakridgensis TaxID=29423 RepID=W0BG26_9GAMM|nr:lipoprotein-releasing ABC transporter permease subunit [Legionella oakridgensis]AHE67384.1 lipoprotein releasing system, transmembrane protein, LolC/E family [Legionella oakridgensis ATCC 33761 = DSM 21215]ETO93044.1 lipoprotein releasing system, transmembrane protein, LolC/E family [Legionella oakridgensis RV-2-2007]KTD43452.1 lipoprotein releasing system, transmembrane protein, LolC/E family [Legionella oakridgensis]STY20443.1 outer membrane-specific lipoprotein transporter subunit; membra
MFKPLALYVGLRYTRAKKKNHFVSFISLSSMLGIGLGVMVLITVLSVMNGFDEEIHKRFFGMAPEITVTGQEGKINNWKALASQLEKEPGIVAIAPYVGGQGLLTHEGQVLPIVLTGIAPDYEQRVNHLQDKLLIGDMKELQHFGIILGRGLADSLGVMVGDKVTIMIPQATVTPAGMIPRFKRFTVKGVFSAGSGFNFDTKLAFINLEDAQKLLQLGTAVSGIKMKIANIYQAPQLSEQLAAKLGPDYEVGNWTQQFGAFFQAVKMEKTMMFLILLLIIAVAAFNLVSSLVMVVNDKQAEIAILRTIGATPSLILWIFIVQGMMVGFVGTLLGLIGGLLLASNATDIVNFLQSLFGVQLLSSNIYFVDYLPSKILFRDLWQICAAALLMSFAATIYPSWRASKTVIAEALHYE